MTRRPAGRRRAVFIDRDGVINRSEVRGGKPYAPRKLTEFALLPRAAGAVGALKKAGFLVIVVTNQPDVGHGLIARETLEAMHGKLRAKVPVDAIMVCPHRQDEGCSCRKPKPGMMKTAMKRYGIAPNRSYMIGDRWNDVVAGHAAGLYTVLVDRGYSEAMTIEPDLKVRSLSQAAEIILERERCMGKTR